MRSERINSTVVCPGIASFVYACLQPPLPPSSFGPTPPIACYKFRGVQVKPHDVLVGGAVVEHLGPLNDKRAVFVLELFHPNRLLREHHAL